ncbi:purine-nucleoside phosphorylase [Dictyobacter aurantiacus]|uniref:Purine nucleoside phosphorylase n=1 Tax=Dictyobacter aurantiacus TaxID=1936993 RepID=A0A401ZH71_9CHLR|nr:purine-nucleoside phosphorylase [Dictyobacter aurantiacus]GCE06186.1 purine nucleoside phosphorylase [Dictyobacter aurantiacus]
MLYEQAMEATQAIQQHTETKPALAIILGSGLGDLVTEMRDTVAIPYGEIPHFPQSTVIGHAGRLLIGTLSGVPVVAMQGRFHFYEGHAVHLTTLPVRVMRLLGAETLIVSNAAGGVNPDYRPGDFMLLRDHIYMPGLAGNNPLVGPHDERLGERFPAVGKAYDAKLRALAREVAARHSEITLHEGVYTMVGGPSYETPAELAFLRTIGTDAVGMSTAPEVVVARQVGMRVLGISLITNSATGSETTEVNHAEVLSTADAVRNKFASLVMGIVERLGAPA